MGGGASVSIGNKTESNVTNSTSNEQYFRMDNIVDITNSMKQKTTSVNSMNKQYNLSSNVKARVFISGSPITVSGKGNTLIISSSANAAQTVEAIAEANAVVQHTSNLTDAVMFDIANNGFSQQYSDMSSAARASSTTELDVSGLFTAAASVGINNTVCTNVNNSIRNVFSMAINNNMSSATERTSLAESINSSTALVNMVNSGDAGIKIENSPITISDEMNLVKIDSATVSGMAVKLQEKLTSNLKSSLTAVTNNIASATTTVEASQKAKSSATATASQSQSTKVSTDSIIWAIAGAIMLGIIGTAVAKAIMCSGKKNTTVVVNNADNKPEE